MERNFILCDGDKIWLKAKDGTNYVVRIGRCFDPDSPRHNDSVATMACFHRRYDLGDRVGFSEPESYVQSLVSEYCPKHEIWNYAKSGKGHVRLVEYEDSVVAKEYLIHSLVVAYGVPYWNTEDSCSYTSAGIDTIVSLLSITDCIELLKDHVYIAPLYLYDHGGITISLCSFADQWDSGQIGWMVLSKKDALDMLDCTEENWREAAEKQCLSEVKEYDAYITGEVYECELLFANDEGDITEENEDGAFPMGFFYGDSFVDSGMADSIEDEIGEFDVM